MGLEKCRVESFGYTQPSVGPHTCSAPRKEARTEMCQEAGIITVTMTKVICYPKTLNGKPRFIWIVAEI